MLLPLLWNRAQCCKSIVEKKWTTSNILPFDVNDTHATNNVNDDDNDDDDDVDVTTKPKDLSFNEQLDAWIQSIRRKEVMSATPVSSFLLHIYKSILI